MLGRFAGGELDAVGADLGDQHAVDRFALLHAPRAPAVHFAQECRRLVVDNRRAGQYELPWLYRGLCRCTRLRWRRPPRGIEQCALDRFASTISAAVDLKFRQ